MYFDAELITVLKGIFNKSLKRRTRNQKIICFSIVRNETNIHATYIVQKSYGKP